MNVDRLLVIYIAQVLLALIIWFLFNHYYKIHKRAFLRLWAMSWLFYALVYTASILMTISTGFLSQVGSSSIIIFTYLQLLFLVFGIYAITGNKTFNKKVIWGCILGVVLFSLATYLLYADDPNRSLYRYGVRVGLKSIITGVIFSWVAFKVLSNSKFHEGLGRGLLFMAFLLYAVQQFWHAGIVFGNIAGFRLEFPLATYGTIDLFSLSLNGFGMMVWLLENEQNQLKKTNRELDSFLYSTSHDLRAPIASILGLTHLAQLDAKEEISKKYFGMIESRIKKLDNTIGDILMLSKSANLELTPTTFKIVELLESFFDRLEFQKGYDQIEIRNQINCEEITTDQQQLKIILINLIANAIKYHDLEKEKPYVLIETNKQGDHFYITVKDNGQGINSSSLPQIFNMFYRANDKSDGTGLGLYIVKEAVGRLDGEIHIESKEGLGTSVIIKLPAIKPTTSNA